MKRIYLDHASTTPMDLRVRERMDLYWSKIFGNPSSIYEEGRAARRAIDAAREEIAAIFGARSDEIIFTGSGTESDNLAILGTARALNRVPSHLKDKPRPEFRHIITSKIEHHAVLNACEHLEKKEGFSITYLKPDKFGTISSEQVKDALTRETAIVSIMYANNEIGTINPIREIAKAIRDKKKEWGRTQNDPPYFHTDACQAAGYLELDVQKLGVDLLTINGSKIYGPKGVGALYKRRGIKLEPIVFGGGQEFKLRSGTENTAGIAGLAEALKLASEEREQEGKRLSVLRDKFIAGIMERISKVVLNGHPAERLPNNVNVSILDIEGEAMLLYLDSYGIAASTGSACDSATLDPSHVILGIGRPYEYAHASMRFTLGRTTTEKDIDYVLEVLPKIAEILRRISPVRIEVGDEAKIGSQADQKLAKAFVSGRPHWE